MGQLIELRPLSKTQDRSIEYNLIVSDKDIETGQLYIGQNRYFYSILRSEFDSIKNILLSHAIAEPTSEQIYGKKADAFVIIFVIDEDSGVSEFYLGELDDIEAFFKAASEQIRNERLKMSFERLQDFGNKSNFKANSSTQ
jgi:hypothetical protein